MKKARFIKMFTFVLFSFLMMFLFNANEVKAVEYQYTAGTFEKEYKDIKVIRFKYDYLTKMGGNPILDNRIDVSNENFYSGRSIDIEIKEYSNWLPFVDDADEVIIYSYSTSREIFTQFKVFEDTETTYTLNKNGVYKVEYRFEDKVIHYCYINIVEDVHQAIVVADSKYENISAFSKFDFRLQVEDGYDLRKYKYYYAFGNVVGESVFEEFEVFTDAEMKGKNAIYDFDKELSVQIIQRNIRSINKKYLFIKIVNDAGKEKVIQTFNSYEISDSVKANVFLVDKNGDILEGKQFYKYNDQIRFKILFNADVSYTNLQFSVDGKNFMNLDNQTTPVGEKIIEYYAAVADGFKGEFKLQTRNNNVAVVTYEKESVSLTVDCKTEFEVDVIKPEISVDEDGVPTGEKKYNLIANVVEENLKEILYYADTCNIYQADKCLVKFNDNHEKIVKAANVNRPQIVIDERFGKFDNKNLALFIKVIDKAGNAQTYVKWGFYLDNVIVPEGKANDMFELEDVKDGQNVIGKQLVVKVPVKYNVSSVVYTPKGGVASECTVRATENDNVVYQCLKVTDFDFNTDVKVVLTDALTNKETYETKFKYSTIGKGDLLLGDKLFEYFDDQNHEMEFKYDNTMNKNAQNIVFGSEILLGIKEKLNIDKMTGLTDYKLSLVYFDGEKEIVVVDNVGNDVTIPSVLDLLSKLKEVESLKLCGIEKCDIELFLKYEYKLNGVPQNRLVKVNYIDQSHKYQIEGFEYKNEVDVGDKYVPFVYKYMSNLNAEINSNDIVKEISIVFKDKNGHEKIVNAIDTNVLGVYTIRESFAYGDATSFPLEYEVAIVDTIAPVIRLDGKDEIIIRPGENFVDPGAVATDNFDKDVVIKTKIEPDFDVNKEGTYIISYWAEDSSGNVSDVITRTIIVKGENDMLTYVIAGGIGLFTILVIVFGTIIEVKKQKKLMR